MCWNVKLYCRNMFLNKDDIFVPVFNLKIGLNYFFLRAPNWNFKQHGVIKKNELIIFLKEHS